MACPRPSGAAVARYYDPQTAQFLTRDPLDALTRSAYGYVGGDPLDGTDPSGLMCWSIHCVVHDVQTVSGYVQMAADGVAVVTAAVGLEPVAGVALAVSLAAGAVNSAATCIDAVTGGPSTWGDCAVNVVTNVALVGFGKFVTPGRSIYGKTVRTAEERLSQGGANAFGDLFGWAWQYRENPGSDGQCPVTPRFQNPQ